MQETNDEKHRQYDWPNIVSSHACPEPEFSVMCESWHHLQEAIISSFMFSEYICDKNKLPLFSRKQVN